LIGTTTENPKFAVNSTIISRCTIWELRPLSTEDCILIWQRVKKYYADKNRNVMLAKSAGELLFNRCSGDARKLITALDTIIEVLLAPDEGKILVEHVEAAIPQKHLVFDRSGNEHFDHASAYQNSIQNSDADGAVYWLVQWLTSGEDPTYVGRRMLVTAFEDCATNPQAATLAMAACYMAEKVGMPECGIGMVCATIVMAQSQRDKTAYRAYKAAMRDVQDGVTIQVPNEMRAGVGGYVPVGRQYVFRDIVEQGLRIARGEMGKEAGE
jgi:putative ATPase